MEIGFDSFPNCVAKIFPGFSSHTCSLFYMIFRWDVNPSSPDSFAFSAILLDPREKYLKKNPDIFQLYEYVSQKHQS